MTDKTITELIAEAKSRAGLCDADTREAVRDTGNIVARLAAALEAAERRADQAEATAEHLHDEDTREIVALTQERDSAIASYEDYLRIHRERDNWKMSAEEAERAERAEKRWERWERRVRIAEHARDQYAAVVEKVRSVIESESGWFRYRAERVSDILATAPAVALREVKAEAIREYVTAARENPHTYYWPPSGVLDDAEQWADEIEKGTI